MASNTTVNANTVNSNTSNSTNFEYRRNVTTLTGAKSLSSSENNNLIVVSGGGYSVTLPPASTSSGYHYQIVCGLEPTGNITVAAGAAIIHLVGKDGGGDAGPSTAGTAVSNVLFSTNCRVGDYLDVVCDGTNYYISTLAHANGAFTTS